MRWQSAWKMRESCQANSDGLYWRALVMPPSSEMTETFATAFSSMKPSAAHQRAAPAEADLHVGADEVGDELAGGGTDGAGRVGEWPGQWGDDSLAQAEGLLQLHFEPRQFGDLARERDFHLIERAGVGQQAHHGDAADVERLGDGALGHALHIVHPGGAQPQPGRTATGRAKIAVRDRFGKAARLRRGGSSRHEHDSLMDVLPML